MTGNASSTAVMWKCAINQDCARVESQDNLLSRTPHFYELGHFALDRWARRAGGQWGTIAKIGKTARAVHSYCDDHSLLSELNKYYIKKPFCMLSLSRFPLYLQCIAEWFCNITFNSVTVGLHNISILSRCTFCLLYISCLLLIINRNGIYTAQSFCNSWARTTLTGAYLMSSEAKIWTHTEKWVTTCLKPIGSAFSKWKRNLKIPLYDSEAFRLWETRDFFFCIKMWYCT